MVRLFQGQSGKIQDLIVINALEGHHVDLDGAESEALCLLNTLPDMVKRVSPRNV
jgi:hypothetical protein